MRSLAAVLFVSSVLTSQDPEVGQIEVSQREATLTVDAPRPLDSAAKTIAERYGIVVNAEDATYFNSEDMTHAPGAGVLVPRGGRLEVRFPVDPDGAPDIQELLQAVVKTANERWPFAYRLLAEDGAYTFVPTRTRTAAGRIVEMPALLDQRITVPAGRRRVMEHADLIAEALSTQTGFRVGCCQGAIAGIPWGMEYVDFGVNNEPARTALTRLIRSASGRYYYLQRCDPVTPGRQTWCFINVIALAQGIGPGR